MTIIIWNIFFNFSFFYCCKQSNLTLEKRNTKFWSLSWGNNTEKTIVTEEMKLFLVCWSTTRILSSSHISFKTLYFCKGIMAHFILNNSIVTIINYIIQLCIIFINKNENSMEIQVSYPSYLNVFQKFHFFRFCFCFFFWQYGTS